MRGSKEDNSGDKPRQTQVLIFMAAIVQHTIYIYHLHSTSYPLEKPAGLVLSQPHGSGSLHLTPTFYFVSPSLLILHILSVLCPTYTPPPSPLLAHTLSTSYPPTDQYLVS